MSGMRNSNETSVKKTSREEFTCDNNRKNNIKEDA
jgi:hypothetical protein